MEIEKAGRGENTVDRPIYYTQPYIMRVGSSAFSNRYTNRPRAPGDNTRAYVFSQRERVYTSRRLSTPDVRLCVDLRAFHYSIVNAFANVVARSFRRLVDETDCGPWGPAGCRETVRRHALMRSGHFNNRVLVHSRQFNQNNFHYSLYHH